MGVDLRDLWRGSTTVTPRYVLWLVGQLPDTSAYHAALRGGPEFRAWTLTNTLLAAAVNLLHAANHQRSGKKRGFRPLVEPPQKRQKARVVRIADVLARRKKQDHN